MIVSVDFPVWGRCIYNLEPQPTDVQEFHRQACVWTLWRNSLRHALEEWRVDAGSQLVGWEDVEDALDGRTLPFADRVLANTACI